MGNTEATFSQMSKKMGQIGLDTTYQYVSALRELLI